MDEGFPFPSSRSPAEAQANISPAPAVAVAPAVTRVPTSSAKENGRSWEMMDSCFDCSIFPPDLHEGLHHPSELYQPLVPPHTPQHNTKGEKGEEKSGVVSKSLWISAQRMLVSWIQLFRSKISDKESAEVLGVSVGVFLSAALAGLFLYLRRRHLREKEFLLFLIREKDERIEKLLHQIAELNAILAAHRKVPVLRKT